MDLELDRNTVESLLADTSTIRTPLLHGQLTWFQRNQNLYNLYFYNTDTQLCSYGVRIKEVRLYLHFS